jgi:hypothetical protein
LIRPEEKVFARRIDARSLPACAAADEQQATEKRRCRVARRIDTRCRRGAGRARFARPPYMFHEIRHQHRLSMPQAAIRPSARRTSRAQRLKVIARPSEYPTHQCRVARTAQSTSLLKPTAWGSGCSLFATLLMSFRSNWDPDILVSLNMTAPRRAPPAMAALSPIATVLQ